MYTYKQRTGVLNTFPRPNGVGLYPGLSAISQAAFPKGLKGFYYAYPERKSVFRYKHVKILAYPTAFYLKSERASD